MSPENQIPSLDSHVIAENLALLKQFKIVTGWIFDPAFDLSQIAAKATLTQVRTERFDPDHVDNMVEDLKKTKHLTDPGSQWPAILVWKISANKYDILNGIHRVEASKKADRKTFPAVIVDLSHDADPATLAQRLKVAANRSNGKPLTADERVDNAVALVKAGVPTKIAAKEVGCSPQAVSNALHSIDTLGRMTHNKINNLKDKFSQELLVEAGKIRNNAPFRESIKLAAKTGMTPADAKTLFRTVVRLGDHEDQMAHILAEDKRLANQAAAVAAGSAIKQQKSVAVRATNKLTAAIKDFDPTTILGTFPTAAARQQALPTLREQRDALSKAISTMEKADRK